MKVYALILAVLLIGGCEQQPEGEPVARARIDGKSGPTPAPGPEPSASIASQMEFCLPLDYL